MVTSNMVKGVGKGTYKQVNGTASLSDSETITATNLGTVVSANLTAGAASGNYAIASVQSIAGNVVTINLQGAASGTAPSTLTAKHTIHYSLFGY